MKIMYVAFDGKTFESEAACRKYEQSFPSTMVMFNENGPTSDVGSALVVYLGQDENDLGAKRFIEECELKGCGYGGIEEDCQGWYVWLDDHYEFMDCDVRKALMIAAKDIPDDWENCF